MNKRIYDLTISLQSFLRERGYYVDIIYDGYEYADIRPLITIEQMPGNNSYDIKGREAVKTTYRWQIGLHASNPVERMKEQSKIEQLLTFNEIPYFNYEKSPDEPSGFFDVEIEGITPMPSDEITKHSRRHTVYFDVNTMTIKRRC